MSYCSEDDVRRAWHNISVAQVPTADVEDSMSQAESIVNSKLSGVYDVPFEDGSVPTQIKYLTRDIAAFMLIRNTNEAIGMDHAEELEAYFNIAMNTLDAIQGGKQRGLITVKRKDLPSSTTSDTKPIFDEREDELLWGEDG